VIADRLGNTVTAIPVQSSGRSTGQVELAGRWRYGADALDYDAGRVLKIA